MNWLGLSGKRILVVGVANKKSVAWHIGQALIEAGADPVFSVFDQETADRCAKWFPGRQTFLCNVEKKEEIEALAGSLADAGVPLSGMVHSIAFADYSDGMKPFHETRREAFLQAVQISAFSLVELSNALKDQFTADASVVTISISTTTMAAEPYGFMGPAKAALDSAVVFLAKSFSAFSGVRFNSVRAGLLKTSSSAGIPGYIDYYLFAEKATLRKQALRTSEVADSALYLLSPRSSGMNGQGMILDGGMFCNYFDREIVRTVSGAD